MLDRKQNVFDDFIAVAEHLVREKYTSPAKLGVMGGSNGGLLVGAVINQRPDLYAVALPAVGVMDILRYDHGYRPTDKLIAERADQWAFAARAMGMR